MNVTWECPADNSWDTHANSFSWLRGAPPALDATYSALLEDLERNNLLDETLVVLMSDICATIYQCLGIDPQMPIYDNGRPIPVAHGGKPIREILA